METTSLIALILDWKIERILNIGFDHRHLASDLDLVYVGIPGDLPLLTGIFAILTLKMDAMKYKLGSGAIRWQIQKPITVVYFTFFTSFPNFEILTLQIFDLDRGVQLTSMALWMTKIKINKSRLSNFCTSYHHFPKITL